MAWNASGDKMVCHGDADRLLRACLDGPAAAELSAALRALDRDGLAFQLRARNAADHQFIVCGRTVGGAAAVWLCPEGQEAAQAERIAPSDLGAASACRQDVAVEPHLLDRLKTGVALFAPDRRLEAYNAAFAALWDLPRAWLETHPTHGALLDRLRETRKLPEQRDFRAWKRSRLALYDAGHGPVDEAWTLPNGHMLAVSFCVTPQGGATVLFEDVTEKVALESSLKTQVATQSATLDVLGEAVAAFGPDGRLALHNAAFADVWAMDRAVLGERPHIRDIARLCLAKFGDEAMWDRLVATVSSSPAQRRHWRKIHRTDGMVLSLSTVPLPNRATLVVFADVTNAFGIETALRDRHEALALVESLRGEYIKQLSYELRTPLNTVLGFAERLAEAPHGSIPVAHREQIDAIVAGAYALKDVADSMLAGLVDTREFANLQASGGGHDASAHSDHSQNWRGPGASREAAQSGKRR